MITNTYFIHVIKTRNYSVVPLLFTSWIWVPSYPCSSCSFVFVFFFHASDSLKRQPLLCQRTLNGRTKVAYDKRFHRTHFSPISWSFPAVEPNSFSPQSTSLSVSVTDLYCSLSPINLPLQDCRAYLFGSCHCSVSFSDFFFNLSQFFCQSAN